MSRGKRIYTPREYQEYTAYSAATFEENESAVMGTGNVDRDFDSLDPATTAKQFLRNEGRI